MARPSLSTFEHPAWKALAGTVAGYLVVLGIMFVLLFVVPLVVFS